MSNALPPQARKNSLLDEEMLPVEGQEGAEGRNNQLPSRRWIAIAGNPNCGKTTLFNALTGSHFKVANYPGVTVEKREGVLSLGTLGSVPVVDTPGIYSLAGASIDEQIATAALLGEQEGAPPDLVVVCVDSTNLERNLYLVTQLLDLGYPIIIALTMVDVADAEGVTIYKELLRKELGVPLVKVVAKKKIGLDSLKLEMERILKEPQPSRPSFQWATTTPTLLNHAQQLFPTDSTPINNDVSNKNTFLALAYIADSITIPSALRARVEATRHLLEENDVEWSSAEATARYRWINSIVKRCLTVDAHKKRYWYPLFDSILTHRVFGVVILFFVLGFIFQSIFLWSDLPMGLIEDALAQVSEFASAALPDGMLKSLIVDGIIGGVGSVLVFIPQIALLTFFLALLEDSGYLARAAFIMDRIMRPFGLQGRSFVPLLSSFACAIPGILSTRTIPSWTDRLSTILVAPLMSCSARLPVYAVLIAAFIPSTRVFGVFSLQGLTLFGMYLLGIVGAAFVSWALRLTVLRGSPAIFVMELPPFRLPQLQVVWREVRTRVGEFLKNAGTIILACSIVLWFLASFPKDSDGHTNLEKSYAGLLGKAIEPIIKPLGYNWEIGIGVIASFAAREVFVSALSTIYNIESADEGAAASSLIELLKRKRENNEFTLPTALSLMVFYVFASQCISTLAVARRETGSWGWVAFMFGYMSILAYISAFITFELATRFL